MEGVVCIIVEPHYGTLCHLPSMMQHHTLNSKVINLEQFSYALLNIKYIHCNCNKLYVEFYNYGVLCTGLQGTAEEQLLFMLPPS